MQLPISRYCPVKLYKSLLNAATLKIALTRQLKLHAVSNWRFLSFMSQRYYYFQFRCQLSQSFCPGWMVCRRLNFYRREGIFSFSVFDTVGSAWKMASSCCKLWFWLACAVCSTCLTLCSWGLCTKPVNGKKSIVRTLEAIARILNEIGKSLVAIGKTLNEIRRFLNVIKRFFSIYIKNTHRYIENTRSNQNIIKSSKDITKVSMELPTC